MAVTVYRPIHPNTRAENIVHADGVDCEMETFEHFSGLPIGWYFTPGECLEPHDDSEPKHGGQQGPAEIVGKNASPSAADSGAQLTASEPIGKMPWDYPEWKKMPDKDKKNVLEDIGKESGIDLDRRKSVADLIEIIKGLGKS